MVQSLTSQAILSIDIGGSHIKASILDENGELRMDYEKIVTPDPATPDAVIKAILELTRDFGPYDKISAGFPGYIKNGVVLTAPNLGTPLWRKVDFRRMLEEKLGKPARLVNDADLQGLGIVSGKGFEMVITLGTGLGTALFLDGCLLPHLELAHHPVTKGKTYDMYIGEEALQAIGEEKWNRRMKRVLKVLKVVFNYDHLYIGGGNSDILQLEKKKRISIVTNKDGIKGGARLWQTEGKLPVKPGYYSSIQ